VYPAGLDVDPQDNFFRPASMLKPELEL
jgi:hypothetical protein